MVKTQLTQNLALQEFFHKRVKKAIELQQLSLSEEVEFYLVNMLSHFSKSENLFQKSEDGHTEYRALVLKLHDSVFAAKKSQKFSHLKSLGDTALYHAGVFSDNLYNKVVDVDYYIHMGGSAYLSLANLSTTRSTAKSLADMFAELSSQFSQLVEILKLSCEQEVASTDHDILKLLDRYQKTGSLKAKEILEQEGISPEQYLSDKGLTQ